MTTASFLSAVLGEEQTCSVSATPSSSHISNLITSRHDCGSETQPWSIQADPGQHVSVSLTDFSLSSNEESAAGGPSPSPAATPPCRAYGYILEGARGASRNVTICAPQKRISFVYESKSNAVEIVLFKRKTKSDSEKFIVQFQG